MDAYRLSIDIQPDILERILYLIYIVKCSVYVLKMYVVNLEENTSGYIRSSKRSIRTLKQMEKINKMYFKNGKWYFNELGVSIQLKVEYPSDRRDNLFRK